MLGWKQTGFDDRYEVLILHDQAEWMAAFEAEIPDALFHRRSAHRLPSGIAAGDGLRCCVNESSALEAAFESHPHG